MKQSALPGLGGGADPSTGMSPRGWRGSMK
jgi:hypothetical protein